MGDDLLDLPVLARAGLSAAPADAAPEVRERVALGQRRRAAAAARSASSSSWCCARSSGGTRSSGNTRRRSDGTLRHPLSCWSRCWSASRSARPGSATSCRTAAGSTAGGRASPRTTCSGSTSSSPTRSIQPIDELSTAAEAAGDPLEIHLILGNLYREKGQVGRAIQEHQSLLQRPHLRKLEHANVLLCLGLDYKRGGFVDRALEAFKEVLRLDPDNRYALSNLEKLYEEQHQWAEAYAMRQKLAARDLPGRSRRGTSRSSRFSRTSSASPR